MGYKPTLGGLAKAQTFLKERGFSLPDFEVDIYDEATIAGFRTLPGKGRKMVLREAIVEQGPTKEVVDVRLASHESDRFLLFTDTVHVGRFTSMKARQDGYDVMIEWSKGEPVDYAFKDFMDSSDGSALINLARWGKEQVSLIDKIKFRLFPGRYAKEVFG